MDGKNVAFDYRLSMIEVDRSLELTDLKKSAGMQVPKQVKFK